MTRLSQGYWQKQNASAFWQWLRFSCKSLVLWNTLLAVTADVQGLQSCVNSGVRGQAVACLNCPNTVLSLGLSDYLHLQVSWTYGLCYCVSLGWFSPEPMFSHHHFSVIWDTLFAMETNICWARDADSGPVGLCSYSWVCVRAVRDSWLMYLVLLSVVVFRAVSNSCHSREGGRAKASRECPITLWGLCAALLPAPHPHCVQALGHAQEQSWH